jgi:nucleoside phosphorylase
MEEAAAEFARKLPNLRKVDALIICPLIKELNPASLVFDFDPFSDEHDNLDGHKIFYVGLTRPNRNPMTLAISVLTKARNVNAALATFKLLLALRFSPEVVILSGIGGGVRDKVALGDVVIANRVIDVASRRLQPVQDALRDDEYPLNPQLLRLLSHLPARLMKRDRWRERMHENVARIRSAEHLLPDQNAISSAQFKVTEGIIVAGEDLVADGSLPEHLEVTDDRVRACDMEGSGFAQAAEECRIPWTIFRGISDFGEEDKSDEWQAMAAFAAAMAARRFLEAEFRLASEIQMLRF